MRTRSPRRSKCGHEVREAVYADTKSEKQYMRTRSPESRKCGHEAWLALPPGWLCFAGGPLCPLGGCASDLPEANLTTRAVARCSAGCRLCRRGDCSLMGTPRSCDEGLELWTKCPRTPRDGGIRVRRSSGVCMPQCEASKAPIGHAQAYRDILNDALTALSIIRRARRLRNLLVKLGFVLCPMSLFKTPRFCIAEAALVCFASWRLVVCY
ncbi:hypothetical protein CRG98_008542 [Punica granatum]|uniref:Uncharacterized protein n=1 Tax=Punica granatum TaxID=22663 RepID=A0A2I0KRI9_PUNGR|nr:hypothetical protein CRG98_008542 [Punica granatum]